MPETSAFELQVADEIERIVGPARPIDDLALFDSVTAATQSPQWRFPSMFAALRYSAAVMVMAVVGTSLYFGLSQGPDDEAPPPAATATATEAPTAEPTAVATDEPRENKVAAIPGQVIVPDRIPTRIEGARTVGSGSIKTPIGRARWVRLFGKDAKLPDLLDGLTGVPGGYAVVEYPGQLWFSPDLLRWERVPLPAPARSIQLDRSGPDLWLRTSDHRFGAAEPGSVRLWRSDDLRDWTEVDLSSLQPPEPQSADWRMELGRAASTDRVGAVPVTYRVGDMSAALGLEELFEDPRVWPVLKVGGEDTYVVENGYEEPVATVRFEETPDGLRVVDAESGRELTVASDLDLDFIERWATPSQAAERRVIVVEGSDARFGQLPELPRVQEIEPWQPAVSVWEVDGQISAFFQHPDGSVRSWTTDDVARWQPGQVIGDDPGEPTGLRELPHRRGDGTWYVGGQREDGRWRSWTSPDLASWERVRQPWTRYGDHYVRLTFDELIIETLDGKTVLQERIGPLRKRVKLSPAGEGEENCGGGSGGTIELGPGVLASLQTRDCRLHDIFIVQFDRFARQ